MAGSAAFGGRRYCSKMLPVRLRASASSTMAPRSARRRASRGPEALRSGGRLGRRPAGSSGWRISLLEARPCLRPGVSPPSGHVLRPRPRARSRLRARDEGVQRAPQDDDHRQKAATRKKLLRAHRCTAEVVGTQVRASQPCKLAIAFMTSGRAACSPSWAASSASASGSSEGSRAMSSARRWVS